MGPKKEALSYEELSPSPEKCLVQSGKNWIPKMADKWLTIDQIADHLQVSKEKIYKLSQKGRMPASKFGGQWRFKKQVVDRWMLKIQKHGRTRHEK